MDALDEYRSYYSKIKTSKNQEYIDSFVNSIIYSFEYSPSYFKITKNNDLNTYYDTWIMDMDAYKAEIGKKKIIMKPNQDLQKGEYINWNNQVWMVISVDPQEQYYNSGVIMLCNYLLKWVDIDKKAIEKYWCIVENKKRFSVGIDEKEFLIEGTGDFQLMTQVNDFTSKIKRDQRFLISTNVKYPQSYKVSRVDNVSNPNLLLVNVMEKGAQLSTYDDTVNMIPDYYKYFDVNGNWIEENTTPTVPPITTGYDVVISGESELIYHDIQAYTATVINNGVNTSNTVIWSLTGNTKNIEIISQDGNNITLKGLESVGSVTLIATISGRTESKNITITLKSPF